MLFVQSMCAFVAPVADTPFPSTVVATMSQFLVGYNTGMARLAEDTKGFVVSENLTSFFCD
jgi:hypothetical protein